MLKFSLNIQYQVQQKSKLTHEIPNLNKKTKPNPLIKCPYHPHKKLPKKPKITTTTPEIPLTAYHRHALQDESIPCRLLIQSAST